MDRRLLLGVWPLAALLVAVVAGIAVGAWAGGVVEPVPFAQPEDDEWTGVLFVAALVGLAEAPDLVGGVVGALVGVLVWAAGLLAGARRLLPPGAQSAPVVLTLVTAFAGTALVLLVWGAARGEQGPPALGAVTAVVAVVLVASCAVFSLEARRRERRASAADGRTRVGAVGLTPVVAEGDEGFEVLGGWFDRAQGQASKDGSAVTPDGREDTPLAQEQVPPRDG